VHRELYGGPTGRFQSPLIGRSAELDELRALYARACAGAGGAAILWGEAGVGKTRLLDEFGSFGAENGARIGAAPCFESLCPPFAPIQEAFAKLGLRKPLAGEAASPHGPSEAVKYREFLSAADTLREAPAPLVLTFDDLQWADFATLEFLAFLTPRLTDSRVLVLGVVRSEHLERDHARAAALANVCHHGAVMLRIDPLSEGDMRVLLTRLWPKGKTLEGPEIKRLCALAEGKPYFAEELVNSALAARDERSFAPPPLSIRAGVLARFQRLTPDERNILVYASVIGRTFDAALLAELSAGSFASVCDMLAQACALQLVREVREHIGQFAFRHAITREILYRELLTAQASSIHAQVAECLSRHSDVDASRLAYHWAAAGHHGRASEAYELAGDAASARYAYRDAAIAYRNAVDGRSPDDRERYAGLCEKLSRTLSINGELGDACAWGQRGVDAYAGARDYIRATRLALFVARRYADAGRQQEGIAAARSATQFFENFDDPELRYSAHVTLARLHVQQEQPAAALAELAAAESSPGERAPEERHMFHDVRGDVRAITGRLGLALAEKMEAIRLARGIGNAERLSITLSNYARFAFFAGRTGEAIAAYREALDLIEREHLGRAAAIVMRALAFVYLLTGELECAQRTLDRSLEMSGGVVAQTTVASIGVRLAYLRGDDELVRCYGTDDAIDLAFRSGQPESIGPLAGSIAPYYDAIGRRADATELRSRALVQIQGANLALWLLDQVATSDAASEVARARSLLDHAAGDPEHAVARAHLKLFDARVARAGRKIAAAKSLALDAAARFETIGWPWERAQALELAGRYADALALYQRHGYLRHARDLEQARRRTRHRAGAHRLTPREVEITRLAAQGTSNRSIAAQLFISERTVETHIAAIFDRFDLTSRRQLHALLDDPAGQVEAKDPP
jgi:DNA-binding CsgD family transcriptional regulator